MPRGKKKKIKKLTSALQILEIDDESIPQASGSAQSVSEPKNKVLPSTSKQNPSAKVSSVDVHLNFNEKMGPELAKIWPKIKNRIPAVFLHNPVDFEQHAKKLLIGGVKFFQPHKGHQHTRINCQTLDDYKAVTGYFERANLPFHTFGLPTKKKIKLVIRGVPESTDLVKLKQAFKSASVPIVRLHKMHRKWDVPGQPILVLVVVPHDNEGRNILKLKDISDHAVKIEKPVDKPKQCHRCQKWGHTQRYCHGVMQCVKCADDHLTRKCTRDKETEPPRCANCGRQHTSSYKLCPFYPNSPVYQLIAIKKNSEKVAVAKPRIVTLETCNQLYCNVKVKKPVPA